MRISSEIRWSPVTIRRWRNMGERATKWVSDTFSAKRDLSLSGIRQATRCSTVFLVRENPLPIALISYLAPNIGYVRVHGLETINDR